MSENKQIGRPTVMTPELVSKLEYAFSIGATDVEACAYAGLSRATYARHREENGDFKDRIDVLKEALPLKAKEGLAKLIQAEDKQTVQWYLERKKRDEFSLKTEVDHTSGGQAITELKITMV